MKGFVHTDSANYCRVLIQNKFLEQNLVWYDENVDWSLKRVYWKNQQIDCKRSEKQLWWSFSMFLYFFVSLAETTRGKTTQRSLTVDFIFLLFREKFYPTVCLWILIFVLIWNICHVLNILYSHAAVLSHWFPFSVQYVLIVLLLL